MEAGTLLTVVNLSIMDDNITTNTNVSFESSSLKQEEEFERPPKKAKNAEEPPKPPPNNLSRAGLNTATDKPEEIQPFLLGLVKRLYEASPDHPIFQSGATRCSYPYVASRSNGKSWTNNMILLANTLQKYRCVLGKNTCWMVPANSISMKGMLICRLLAFWMEPTEQNYFNFVGLEPEKVPFDHWCGRGQKSPEQRRPLFDHEKADKKRKNKDFVEIVCINGIEHGGFSIREVNEDRKKCTNGALCLCPGHLENLHKCIFTRPDGSLAVCRMHSDHVSKCNCRDKDPNLRYSCF